MQAAGKLHPALASCAHGLQGTVPLLLPGAQQRSLMLCNSCGPPTRAIAPACANPPTRRATEAGGERGQGWPGGLGRPQLVHRQASGNEQRACGHWGGRPPRGEAAAMRNARRPRWPLLLPPLPRCTCTCLSVVRVGHSAVSAWFVVVCWPRCPTSNKVLLR